MTVSEPHVDYKGNVYYYDDDGRYHRDGGPAVVDDASESWYQHGKLHRVDGPAVVFSSGLEHWYQDGKLHRDDGPAIDNPNGTQVWYTDGKVHRLDGPAMIFPNGLRKWYRHGQLHRPDGPAVELSPGRGQWYKYGNRITPPYQGVPIDGDDIASRITALPPGPDGNVAMRPGTSLYRQDVIMESETPVLRSRRRTRQYPVGGNVNVRFN